MAAHNQKHPTSAVAQGNNGQTYSRNASLPVTKVKFVVYVSTLFDFKPAEQRFVIIHEHPPGKNKQQLEMEVKPTADGKAYLATAEATFTASGRVDYSYAAVSNRSNAVEWEDSFQSHGGNQHLWRSFYLNQPQIYRYDFLTLPQNEAKNEDVIKRIKRFFATAFRLGDKTSQESIIIDDLINSYVYSLPSFDRVLLEKFNFSDLLARFQRRQEAFKSSLCQLIEFNYWQNVKTKCMLRYLTKSVEHLQVSTWNLKNADSSLSEIELKLNIFGCALTLLLVFGSQLLTARDEIDNSLFDSFCELFLQLPPAANDYDLPSYRNDMKTWFTKNFPELFKVCQMIEKMFFEYSEHLSLLYLLPLYHSAMEFITLHGYPNLTVPYNDADNAWYGIGYNLKHEFAQLKQVVKGNPEALDIIYEHLEPLFELDQLLPRSLIALIDCDSRFPQFLRRESLPLEAVLARVLHHVKDAQLTQKFEHTVRMCSAVLKARFGDDQRLREAIGRSASVASQLTSVCCDFVPLLINILKNNRVLRVPSGSSTDQSLQIIDLARILAAVCQAQPTLLSDSCYLKIVSGAFSKCCQFLTDVISSTMDTGYVNGASKQPLEAFMQLYRVLQGITLAETSYCNILLESFNRSLRKNNDATNIQMYCELNWATWPVELRENFETVCVAALQNALKQDSCSKFLRNVCNAPSAKIALLVSSFFEKQHMPDKYDDVSQFLAMLNWPALPTLMQNFCMTKERFDLLSPRAKESLQSFANWLFMLSNDVESGDIQAKQFMCLEEQEGIAIQKMQEIAGCMEVFNNYDGESVLQLENNFAIRKKQLLAFNQQRERVRQFVQSFRDLAPPAVRPFEQRLDSDWSSVPLNQLCTITRRQLAAGVDAESDVEANVIWFKLNGELHENILKLYLRYCDSNLLNNNVNLVLQKTAMPENLNDIFQKIYDAYEESKKRAALLFDNKVMFADLRRIFATGTPTLQYVEKELQFCNSDHKTSEIELRCKAEKIFNAFSVLKCAQTACVIQKLCDTYALINDASQQGYALLANIESEETLNERSLSEITEQCLNFQIKNTQEAVKLLSALPECANQCLLAFVEAKELVDWIVDNVETAANFRTLIDLAQISAGEGDAELGKVECIERAVNGFEALIFSLRNKSEKLQSLQALLETCKSVWKNAQADTGLLKTLRDARRFKDWLATVKATHGSVEMTALQQADQLVSNGVFTLGESRSAAKSKFEGDKRQGNMKLSLDDVLSASVEVQKDPVSDNQGDVGGEEANLGSGKRKYSYSELRDLVDKLVLIAGNRYDQKKLESVKYLMMLFTSLETQANEYIALRQQGTLLFDSFKVIYFCNADAEPRCVLDFCSNLRVLTSNDPPVQCASKLTDRLRKCMNEWQEYVKEKRDRYGELNHFTMQQLVILRSQLWKLSSNGAFDERVLDLVSAVVGEVHDETLLRDAVKTALTREKELEQQAGSTTESKRDLAEDPEDQASSENENELRDEDLRAHLENFDISSKLIARALELKHEFASENDVLMWCFDHADEEYEEPTAGGSASNPIFGNGDDDKGILKSALEELFKNDVDLGLIEDDNQPISEADMCITIETIWKKLVFDMNRNLQGYLSLDGLGRVLQHIRSNLSVGTAAVHATDRAQLPESNKLYYLDWSKPNVVVTAERDMLLTLLSLYAHTASSTQCNWLPQADEVLVCSSETTSEQLELLWRRALQHHKTDDDQLLRTKLYCALYADRVPTAVVKQAEDKLKKLQMAANANVKHEDERRSRLVLLLSREHEDRSAFMCTLDYHRPDENFLRGIAVDEDKLRTYIKRNAVLPDASTWIKAVDAEGCTMRVLRSSRAGMGKSLYVKRCAENLVRALYGAQATAEHTERHTIIVAAHNRVMQIDEVLEALFAHDAKYSPANTAHAVNKQRPRIIHLDVAHNVHENVDAVLFELLIVGRLSGSDGYVWLKRKHDVFLVENVALYERAAARAVRGRPFGQQANTNEEADADKTAVHRLLELLPRVQCRSPYETLRQLNTNGETQSGIRAEFYEQLVDDQLFASSVYRKPATYLHLFATDAARQANAYPREQVEAVGRQLSRRDLLQVVLTKCGLENPSWAELNTFLSFLNTQLESFERNSFCSVAALEDLPGFREFVVRLLVQMSRDFATRSLNIAEQTPTVGRVEEDTGDALLEEFSLKRRWESSAHPYLFFNADGHSFTFLGFNVRNAAQGQLMDLIDASTNTVLEPSIMQRDLYDRLERNKVNFKEVFESLKREVKLAKMGTVMSSRDLRDADASYELTTDNVKKLLAIYMRLSSNIPVIIMGETGCGKTRMIKFLCDALLPQELVGQVKNLYVVKVHGGITEKQLNRVIVTADRKAKENAQKQLDTILFLDEVNSSEAVGSVKQVMCDRRVGRRTLHERLKIICSCNPYRKHSDEVIKRLEKLGLGYRVRAEEATDRFGQMAMRQLVYRVKPLPLSLVPFCWDFGQLSAEVERLYIRQLVLRAFSREPLVKELEGPLVSNLVTEVLSRAQEFMREHLNDECLFVSLRDVERALSVMEWFYRRSRDLFTKMDKLFSASNDASKTMKQAIQPAFVPSTLARSVVLSLCVCYYVSLQFHRRSFVENVVAALVGPLAVTAAGKKQVAAPASAVVADGNILNESADRFIAEFVACQKLFLEECEESIPVGISLNEALRENVFMMIVCMELRIPLFLVGKPGSSKSLAKQIVHDSLQGDQSRSKLFKEFKKITMVSYQCSPLSTADGIIGTFRQAARFQKEKDLERFASVVVLDEIGLAEDSNSMALKTLHALLETGVAGFEDEHNDEQTQTQNDEQQEAAEVQVQFRWENDADLQQHAYKRVAFIGISNWALDPAKTNRGILVQRVDVDERELVETAIGILRNHDLTSKVRELISLLAKGYIDLCAQLNEQKAFFGLRDFYALIKMVAQFASATDGNSAVQSRLKVPTWAEIQYCIQRNFDGLNSETIKPIKVFAEHLANLDKMEIPDELPSLSSEGPDSSTLGVVKSALQRSLGQRTAAGQRHVRFESRYLLLLTENYAALRLLLQREELATKTNVVTIFGSKFPDDVKFTQICSYMNRIKMAMEVGSTVVVLNLSELYESLYDALNQYYSYFGQDRYVDLGLGTQRVKCKVHEDFNLIVLAHEQTVQETFPIPLINRLEKHKFSLDNVLVGELGEARERVAQWCEEQLKKIRAKGKKCEKVGDLFIGFTEETAAYMVLNESSESEARTKPLSRAAAEEQTMAIVENCKRKLRQCMTVDFVMTMDDANLIDQYWYEDCHRSLQVLLERELRDSKPVEKDLFLHVTTFTQVITLPNVEQLKRALFANEAARETIRLCTLQQFDSLQKFSKFIELCLEKGDEELLIVQCDRAQANSELIDCAQFAIEDVYTKLKSAANLRLQEREETATADGSVAGKLAKEAFVPKRLKQIRVMLLLHLTRNSRQRFSGFPCGIWKSVHLDELFAHSLYDTNTDVVNDLMKLRNHSLAEALHEFGSTLERASANERAEAEAPAVNFVELIRQCVPEAVSMLQYGNGMDGDNTEAVDQKRADLIRAFSGVFSADAHSPNAIRMQKIFIWRLQHLVSQDAEHRRNLDLRVEEITSAASKEHMILEHGTLQQAIITVLKLRMKPFLGALIAFMDEDGQLLPVVSQLTSTAAGNERSAQFIRLWLDILDDPQVGKFDYENALALAGITVGALTESRKFLLKQSCLSTSGADIRFPFASRWRDDVVKLAEVCSGLTEQRSDNDNVSQSIIAQSADLCRSFVQTPQHRTLNCVLTAAEAEAEAEEVLESYLSCHVSQVFSVKEVEHDAVVYILQTAADLLQQRLVNSNTLKDTDVRTFPASRITVLHVVSSLLDSRLRMLHQIIQLLELLEGPALGSVGDATNIKRSVGRVLEKLKSFKEEELLVSFDLLFLEELLSCLIEVGKKTTKSADALSLEAWLNTVHEASLLAETCFESFLHVSQGLQCLFDQFEEVEKDRKNRENSCRSKLNVLVLISTLLSSMQSTIGLKNKDIPIEVKLLETAWSLFEKDRDFAKQKTFDRVKQLLEFFNKTVCKRLFGLDAICTLCKKHGAKREQAIIPVVLPCKHVLCRQCFRTVQQQLDMHECPECKRAIPDDYERTLELQCDGAYAKHKLFQQFANRFMADVASRLIFTTTNLRDGNIDEAVFKMLVGYVTASAKTRAEGENAAPVQTKQFSVFADIFDSNPVFRSFLLKLALRAGGDQTLQFLECYLQQAAKALNVAERMRQYEELQVMCVNCIEDSYAERPFERAFFTDQFNKYVTGGDKGAGAGAGAGAATANVAEMSLVEELQQVALVRYLLEHNADRIVEELKSNDMQVRVTPDGVINDCLQFVGPVCQNAERYSKWPLYYFMRIVLRKFGLAMLQHVVNLNEMKWLLAHENMFGQNEQAEASQDVFVLYDQVYIRVRQAWLEFLVVCDVDKLDAALQEQVTGELNQHRLALFSKLVLSRIANDSKTLVSWQQAVQKATNQKLALLLRKLARNLGMSTQHASLFDCYLEMPTKQKNEQLFVLSKQIDLLREHFEAVVFGLVDHAMFLEPLVKLATAPAILLNCYLPSMPQNELAQVHAAVAEKFKDALMYACPNGHPYVVENCGRPIRDGNKDSICPVCGAKIGGAGYHILQDGNFKVTDLNVQTLRGHVLGRAADRTTRPVPERQNSVATSVLRLLTHLAMYTASKRDEHLAKLANLIVIDANSIMNKAGTHPEIQGVRKFVFDHLAIDLQTLSYAVGLNVDECCLFLHVLISDLLKPAQGLVRASWLTTKERNNFETTFVQHYLNPLLQNFDIRLRDVQQRVLNDGISKINRLTAFLLEFDNQNEPGALPKACWNPAMWRFRRRITVHTFECYVERTPTDIPPKKLALLKHFLNQISLLEQLKHLPALLHVQTSMEERCSRRWSVETARKLTIDQFLSAKGGVDERLAASVRQFIQLWNTLRCQVVEFKYRGWRLPDKYRNEVLTDKSSVEFLLASLKGAGICIVMLTGYLIEQHNQVVELYAAAKGLEHKQIGTVKVGTLTSAQTFSFDSQKDVLTKCILRNCTYTVDSSKKQDEADVAFDVGAVVEDLEDQLCRNRPLLDYSIPTIVYFESVNDRDTFINLNRRVKQLNLADNVRDAIRNDIGNVAQVNEVLTTVSLVMRLAVIMTAEKDGMLLANFLSKMGMTTELWSRTIKKSCSLAHLQSLYKLLSLHRACLICDGGSDAFERVSENLRTPIESDDVKTKLASALRKVDTWPMLELLNDVIRWKLQQSADNRAAVNEALEYPLKDMIEPYLDDMECAMGEETAAQLRHQVDLLPDIILAKHLVSTWNFFYGFAKKR